MKQGDENSTGFFIPNGQWVYLRMGQGLKGAAHTYSQFSDLVFGSLPSTSNGKIKRESTIIRRNTDAGFSIYMDDHVASTRGFDAMYKFLATEYFPRVAFGPVYLSGKKTRVCDDQIEILGYERNKGGIKPSLKHRQQIRDWPRPTCRAELEAFLWLTPFLKIIIPGQATHVLTLKEA